MPPASGRLCENFGGSGGLTGLVRDAVGLLKCAERRTVLEVDLRELERPQRITPTANVKFRTMKAAGQEP